MNPECSFLQEKAQESWLQKVDQNTKFFFASTAQKTYIRAIKAMLDKNGVLQTEHKKIGESLVKHSSFLDMKKQRPGPSFKVLFQDNILSIELTYPKINK